MCGVHRQPVGTRGDRELPRVPEERPRSVHRSRRALETPALERDRRSVAVGLREAFRLVQRAMPVWEAPLQSFGSGQSRECLDPDCGSEVSFEQGPDPRLAAARVVVVPEGFEVAHTRAETAA